MSSSDYITKNVRLNEEYPKIPLDASIWTKFKFKFYQSLLVSPRHPLTMEFFKSEIRIFDERKRHYDNFKYTIHPMSRFNQFFEVWSFFFYAALLFFKAYDLAFIVIRSKSEIATTLGVISTIVEILSWFMIVFQFFIGFGIYQTRYVELSKSKIALRYLTNGHFICDLFSSIPKFITDETDSYVFNLYMALNILKLRRVSTIISLIRPTAKFFRIKSNTKIFLIGFFFLIALAMHIMTCMHVSAARYRLEIEMRYSNESYTTKYFLKLPLVQQYFITFFKSAQYTFLVDLPYLRDQSIPEETAFCLINYIIGKIFIAIIWIVLLFTFLSQRELKIRFEEIMTELNDYMKSRQVPQDLKNKLISYYKFKYQNIFFNEVFIRTILSQNLKREIDVYLCKSLIKQVSIFSKIPSRTVRQIVSHLIPEIHLPNDLIIQSNTFGDCMYFIESGTVAVFTPSGREICHLNDGAYFGEISILIKDQKRTASIIAIETTRLFKLTRKQFNKCFNKDENVYNILLESAKKRIEETKNVELKYKQFLFEKVYTPSDDRDVSLIPEN